MVGVWEMVVGDSQKDSADLSKKNEKTIKCLFWFDLLFLCALKVAKTKQTNKKK